MKEKNKGEKIKLDRFILNYEGNKYQETKKHLKDYLKNDYKYIIEPFCGIFGFSRAHYELYPEADVKYILNDINTEHISYLNYIKDNYNKEELFKFLNDNNINDDMSLKEWAKNNKTHLKFKFICSIARGCNNGLSLLSFSKLIKKIENYESLKHTYNKFFNKVIFYNMELNLFLETIKPIILKEKSFIFYDPPYFDSYNAYYSNMAGKDIIQEGLRNFINFRDSSEIYISILHYCNTLKCSFVLVINSMAILKYIYKDYYIKEYPKVYQNLSYYKDISHKKLSYHSIYSNVII
jgi:hypothetical protein